MKKNRLFNLVLLLVVVLFVQASHAQDDTRLSLPDGAIARLGKGYVGKSDRAVAFSRDGQRLAVASSIGIYLYDVATSRELSLLPSAQNVNSVAFSLDGTILASGSNDRTVKLWDVATRTNTATLEHRAWAYSVDFSPDGTMLASGAWDGKVKLWDTSVWTAPITPVSQRTSQVREAILGVVRLDDPNVSSYADVTVTHLGGITALYLNGRSITSLAHGDFDGLTGLEELRLYSNQLTSLPEDIFLGLSSLETLRLGLNQLTALPDSIFEGLTGLTTLALGGNAVDPLPISISLEKTGEGQFKAVAPAGAPFDVTLPIRVRNGDISGGATTLTIPAGSVESEILSVTRTTGTSGAVSVWIGPLPGLPASHTGYRLVKDTDEVRSLVIFEDISEQVWSGTITYGSWGNAWGNGNATGFGYSRHHNAGSISNATFTYRGTTYSIHGFGFAKVGNNPAYRFVLTISSGFPTCDKELLSFGGLQLADASNGSA